ncbi:MAG: hypothetical protein U0W40_08100 [Acidimicrobiia bacterium]
MIRKLSFTRRRDRTSVLVDGEDRTVESFDEANAQLMARLLQGWIPQELGLERIQYETVGKPIWKARDGSAVFAARSLTRVIVELPGANRPEVDFDDCERLYFDGPVDPGHGVAVLGLDEGSPIVPLRRSASASAGCSGTSRSGEPMARSGSSPAPVRRAASGTS